MTSLTLEGLLGGVTAEERSTSVIDEKGNLRTGYAWKFAENGTDILLEQTRKEDWSFTLLNSSSYQIGKIEVHNKKTIYLLVPKKL